MPTFLSLFCGAGGLDLGFLNVGFNCSLAIDCDGLALDNHERNLGGRTLQADLSRPIDVPSIEPVDVLIAGPPCQGFSTLGPGDPRDPRNALLQVPARVATRLRPAVVVIENVFGATSPGNIRHVEQACATLVDAGYRVRAVDLDMRDAGLAQRRRRVLLIAWRTESDIRISTAALPPVDLASVLGDVARLPNHEPAVPALGSRSHRIVRKIPPGKKLCNVRVSPAAVRTWDIPTVFGATSTRERKVLESLVRLRRRDRRRPNGDADPVRSLSVTADVGFPASPILKALVQKRFVRRIDGYYDLAHTFNGKYRRPDPTGLAPAVDSRFGDFRYVLHPIEHRAFSAREAARIQGFPDWFTFSGSRRSQMRLIANAVPPPAAQRIAADIKAHLQNAS